MGLDTKTYWLTDRQSQCDFDLEETERLVQSAYKRSECSQAAPQLSSRGCVDPDPDPLLHRKSGSAGNRTGTSGSVARNSDH
jgi:hypothetical protein